MRTCRTAFIIALTGSALAGCATKEYQRAAAECSISAYQQYPIALQQVLRTAQRPVDVPTGRTICKTIPGDNGVTRTICDQVLERRYETYQYWTTVDINKEPRDDIIESCAKGLCMQRFGNDACKEAD